MTTKCLPFPAPARRADRQLFWARVFGDAIEQARRLTGLAVEQVAMIAGVSISEWSAIEAGSCLPQTADQMLAVGKAVDLRPESILEMVVGCNAA